MADKGQCTNGHWYDKAKYQMCPHCGAGEKTSATMKITEQEQENPFDVNAEEMLYLKRNSELRNNRYIIQEKVGQGGFGITYKAFDVNLERLVAVKEFFSPNLMHREASGNEVTVYPSARESYELQLLKFKREAGIASMFRDTDYCVNCIKTYDTFEENGTAYIVMEYIDYMTLKDYMKNREELLPLQEIKEIIMQVLIGIENIHQRGVLHLDIAPDNIFIGRPDGVLKVIISDFGAARLCEDAWNITDNDIIVKQGYTPLEQYSKKGKVGPWSDVYAAGANLYQMLTGQKPLGAVDRMEMDDLKKPSKIRKMPTALSDVTMKAMSLRPENRYASAEFFLRDIRRIIIRNNR